MKIVDGILTEVENSDLNDGTFEIPIHVAEIGADAFKYCTDLKSITIPGSVISISNGAFSHCTGLTSITIPDSVTSIGDLAFYGCTGLTSITIPDSVTSIGDWAFGTSINLAHIVVDDANQESYERIKVLLPVELQQKVIPPREFLNQTEMGGRLALIGVLLLTY